MTDRICLFHRSSVDSQGEPVGGSRRPFCMASADSLSPLVRLHSEEASEGGSSGGICIWVTGWWLGRTVPSPTLTSCVPLGMWLSYHTLCFFCPQARQDLQPCPREPLCMAPALPRSTQGQGAGGRDGGCWALWQEGVRVACRAWATVFSQGL